MFVPRALAIPRVCARFAPRVAAVDGRGAELGFAGLAERAAALADRLVAAGVGPGVAVAHLCRNRVEAVWRSYAIQLAGGCEVALNAGLASEEIAYCLGVMRAGVLVGEPGDTEAHATGRTTVDVGGVGVGVAAMAPFRWPLAAAGDHARATFTSGTTGRPKAAIVDQAAWTASIVMLRAAMPRRVAEGDRVLLMTPFSHGASLLTFAFLESGASVHLLEGIDEAAVRRVLDDRSVTDLFAPPTVLRRIVEAVGDRRYDHIRTVCTGTATLSPGLYAAARAVFGPVIRVTYGMSEMVNPITVLEPAETERWYGADNGGDGAGGACLGWPPPGVDVAVRGPDGAARPAGETGEIHVMGPQLFCGYRTADGFTPRPPGAYHPTGDLGWIDASGRLVLAGRAHDVINTGGYKVFPQEIEAALSPLGEVGVVALASEYWENVIVAAVEAAAGSDWRERAEALAAPLSRHKRPRAWVRLDALPRNAVGKVDRRRLARLIADSHRLVDGRHPVLEPLEP